MRRGAPIPVLAAALVVAGCAEPAPPAEAPPPGPAAPRFTDVTEAAGLSFVHDAGARGDYRLPEGIGSGGALFDADGDDDLDLYLVQAGPLDGSVDSSTSRLFRNDGAGRFRGRHGGDGGRGRRLRSRRGRRGPRR